MIKKTQFYLFLLIFLFQYNLQAVEKYKYVREEKINPKFNKVSINYKIQNSRKEFLSYEEVIFLAYSLDQNNALKSCFLEIMRNMVLGIENYRMQHNGFRFNVSKEGANQHFQLRITGNNQQKIKTNTPTWLTKSYDILENQEGKSFEDVFKKVKKMYPNSAVKAVCFASPNGNILIATLARVATAYNLAKENDSTAITGWLQLFLGMIYLFYDKLEGFTPFSRAGTSDVQTRPHIHGRISNKVLQNILKGLLTKNSPLILAVAVQQKEGIRIILNNEVINHLNINPDRIKNLQEKKKTIQSNQHKSNAKENIASQVTLTEKNIIAQNNTSKPKNSENANNNLTLKENTLTIQSNIASKINNTTQGTTLTQRNVVKRLPPQYTTQPKSSGDNSHNLTPQESNPTNENNLYSNRNNITQAKMTTHNVMEGDLDEIATSKDQDDLIPFLTEEMNIPKENGKSISTQSTTQQSNEEEEIPKGILKKYPQIWWLVVLCLFVVGVGSLIAFYKSKRLQPLDEEPSTK